jgi:hypothetical protein
MAEGELTMQRFRNDSLRKLVYAAGATTALLPAGVKDIRDPAALTRSEFREIVGDKLDVRLPADFVGQAYWLRATGCAARRWDAPRRHASSRWTTGSA